MKRLKLTKESLLPLGDDPKATEAVAGGMAATIQGGQCEFSITVTNTGQYRCEITTGSYQNC
ncbi:MAG TPA: hypothetical protein VFT46_05375 [Holophagaceae bacterium]|nr:hypothetical protein [Holophagaceae bacterium]